MSIDLDITAKLNYLVEYIANKYRRYASSMKLHDWLYYLSRDYSAYSNVASKILCNLLILHE